MRAFKFRLYPNRKQEERMVNAVKVCRRLWNTALADRQEAWEHKHLSTTYAQQCAMLAVEKESGQSLLAVYSQSLQDVLRRLDETYKRFFEHKAEYPKPKKQFEYGSFTYPQAYNGSVKLDLRRKRLFLSKIGNVRVVIHRDIPLARLKTCAVRRERDGKWYASLVYDEVVPLQDVKVPESWRSPIGVDVGLISLVATSDGEEVAPPKFFRKTEKKLKRAQRVLSRRKKGSKN